jgi:hypothetical protein
LSIRDTLLVYYLGLKLFNHLGFKVCLLASIKVKKKKLPETNRVVYSGHLSSAISGLETLQPLLI